MKIGNIQCDYTEYRRKGNKWVKTDKNICNVDSDEIANMIEASSYFTNLGGEVDIKWSKNRRFGLIPIAYKSISSCGLVKRIYKFNYDRGVVLC